MGGTALRRLRSMSRPQARAVVENVLAWGTRPARSSKPSWPFSPPSLASRRTMTSREFASAHQSRYLDERGRLVGLGLG